MFLLLTLVVVVITWLRWIKRICENNILTVYEEELPINIGVVGVGTLHSTHSVVHTYAVLPVHVQAVLGKFSHYLLQLTE